jgi:hypothetical protein
MNTMTVVPALHSVVHSKPHAHSLDSATRKGIALKALVGGKPSHIARADGVSRKFVYKQLDVAKSAVDEAFASVPHDDEKVLFTIVVTRALLQRMILALLLRCCSSYRGVISFLDDMFGYSVSLGMIHNIVKSATVMARTVNSTIRLDGVEAGLHDEIYQHRKPVLVGVDARSSFCYLLAAEDSCDGTTWGYHLLDLQGKGFSPAYVVADQGKGHRAGLKEASPSVPCFADVFHILKDFGDVVRFYENRATSAAEELKKIEKKMASLKRKQEKQNKLSRSLGVAREKERETSDIAFILRTLRNWLRLDILAIAGPNFIVRLELLNFVIDELRKIEIGSSKIASFRQKLENAKEEILGFVEVVDSKLRQASAEHALPLELLEKIAIMLNYANSDLYRYEIETELRGVLRERFYEAVSLVTDSLESTPRASSLVESVNSRLRNYFFLRREIGNGYLDLLQFYLNHRILVRSDRSHRVGKTPREALTGQKHENWLDILGFPKVKQTA